MLEVSVYYVGMAGEGTVWPEKALQSLKTLVTIYQTTPRHVTEDLGLSTFVRLFMRSVPCIGHL